jgi:indolepyruvate ferredoxin oxidoreductase
VLAGGSDRLALAVAHYYFKLLAYKDEYEVARLLSDRAFREQLDREFVGDYRIELNLAPQLLNRRDPLTGRAKKRTFGPWVLPVLRVLAEGRRVRGTALDVFGKTAHRRRERSLIATYEEWLGELEQELTTANHEIAVQLAEIPESIRGFDTVKEESIDKALASVEDLHTALRAAEVTA